MKSRYLSAFASLLIGGQAFAQESLPVQQFAPAPGGDNNFVTVQGSGVLSHLEPAFGAYLNYANAPLVLRRLSNGEQVSLVEHHLQLDLIAALGIGDMFEIGLALPFTLYQAAGDPTETLRPDALEKFTTGDIKLYPKVSILHDEEGFGLAFLVPMTLPTGSPENLQGNESVTFEPRVAADYGFSREFRAGLSLGFLLRPEKQQLFNVTAGNELTFGAGLEYEVVTDTVAVIAEGYGKISVESGTQSEERPVEVALSGRWWPATSHAVTVGVARGITEGYGAPNVRVFAGYNYTPHEDLDPDGDGLRSTDDACPNDPEDFDEFEDTDGCPDRDNDRDGLADKADKCPNVPEDYDGFEDFDGCPETDNDGDGILDVNDKCPNEAEDFDGFNDEDGCADPDNDGDGLLDGKDGPTVDEKGLGSCANDPEDQDGYQDEDGCPDPDNDGDGILDINDTCPNDKADGCRATVVNGCEIQILDQVFFKYDRDEIDEQKSAPILDAVAEILRANKWIKLIEVQGHTDSDGPDEYNAGLSDRRAKAVVAYLSNKGKVEAARMQGKGYGEKVPLASNATPDGRAKNRRVQFIILDPSQDKCKK